MTSSPYIPSTDNDRKEMIEAIGVKNFEGLLTDIPKNFLFPELKLQDKLSEPELVDYFTELGNKNVASKIKTSFLGGGSYNHYIPSTVKAMIQRGEFLTAYTPYQPEASQGTLQVGFEFQTMIAQLFEMDVCNAGMYDGPTALAEAALMACRVKRNNKIVIHESISEKLLDVLKSYSKWQDIEIIHADQINISKEEDLACLLVQSPDKNGEIIDVESFSDQIHEKNGLLIQHTYPTSLGLLKPPGSLNVDIATAEGQSLGVPLSLGGPYIGLLTCKNEYIRQLPGRIIGQTVDKNGKISFALTLQTREQHIRRESATSNICTSTQLIGLMVAVYVATMGPHGIKHIAETCFHRAHYMAKKLDQIEGFNLLSKDFFNEFVIQTDISVSKINSFLLENGIEGGIDISADGKNLIMLAVTELNSPSNIEETLNLLGGLSE
ncbi:MAG: aminomethyl-transferring glycine dehydrogenase subunit GcvPA [Chloroflexi bacterium]|nr:MAG: aminomethyl-transferring glycine dehydrogenase subunit GcvPA [Chloroflexota bacterium]